MLLSTDYGLFSVFVIAFVIVMSIWFSMFFSKKIRDSERLSRK
ncbi:MAG TPA: DUF3149 domain-containing protein [Accumulibacter sp.]|nr:DUF3149 domain-containing protein [Accumulibacter sp.]HMW16358.1 DUF3149 domain-containing protein [Accumulibacter sp.]HMX22225.1 DUF3149 domain-containing protein [Accumulibacter sp.]HMY06353.1 DUF3149 domain-containing protein [Accumulibacter sp.]HNC17369.1 DUF3149 domain-containing protein [Accumulibacter sp.]